MPSIKLSSVDDPHITKPLREEWQDDARCAEIDPDLFFPEQGGSAKAVKDICRSCKVKDKCLAYALKTDIGYDTNGHRYGIFGGLSPRERKAAQALLDKHPDLAMWELRAAVSIPE